MTQNEANSLKVTLEQLGYHKSGATSSRNDWSMFKSVRDDNDVLLYQIEFRFWDWMKYQEGGDDFGVDICIIDEVKHRAWAELSYPMNIEDVERYAKQFHELNRDMML